MTGSHLPPPRHGPTRARTVVAAATGAVLILGTAAVGVTAWAAGVGGRGVEPEAVAPASSITFERLDLNPSLAQKLDIVRFARTVSAAEKAAGVGGSGPTPHTFAGVRADLIDAVFGEIGGPVPLRAWFTGRAAIDAYPDRTAPRGIAEVGILQYDNASAMRRALSYEARTAHAGYAVDTADSYVIVADSTRLARRALAAGTAHPLAADPTFRADVASLPQHDDPGLIWADVSASLVNATGGPHGVGVSFGDRAPALLRAAASRALGSGALGSGALGSGALGAAGGGLLARTGSGPGTALRSVVAATRAQAAAGAAGAVAPGSAATDERLVIGLRIGPTAVDVQGRLRNAPAQTSPAGRGAAGSGPTALSGVRGLPANALAALSVTGLGPLLGAEYTSAVAGDHRARSTFAQLGIRSAGDLRVLFGSVTTAALLPAGRGPGPVVTVSARSPHPARGLAVAKRVLARGGAARGEFSLHTSAGRILLRTPAGSLPAPDSGLLGSTALFRDAVPDASTADAICFVNVTRAAAADTGLSARDRAELSPITAVGLTTRGGADAAFHLRVIVT